MYFIDDNNNNNCDSNEYYIANDITLDGVDEYGNAYNKNLGFKTSTWGYPSSSASADDKGLYYFVLNSLDVLKIEMKNEEAKTKYRYITFEYKIQQGHGSCLGNQNIDCTVKSYFED